MLKGIWSWWSDHRRSFYQATCMGTERRHGTQRNDVGLKSAGIGRYLGFPSNGMRSCRGASTPAGMYPVSASSLAA